jgi:predicted transcriptional regulator of viral defense system
LGQWQFTVQGLRYYLTSRDPRYLQAFQTRYLDDKCWYKVTTLEQTLIDTLHRPMNCGGPAAVFEAWETAVERMDVTKLVGLLNQIKDRRLFQRAGYLLEAHGIDGVLPLADEDVGEPPVPLFAGIPFTRHSKRWGLLIP